MTQQTGRFGALLAAMLLNFVLAPVLAASPVGLAGPKALAFLVLLAGLFVVRAHRWAIALFGLAVGGQIVAAISPTPWAGAAAGIFALAFLVYVLALVIVRVLSQREVTYDTIAGAACGYVLLGLVWGELFILVDMLSPGGFDVPASFLSGPEGGIRPALMYFSLATLTTVGYGDIHPNWPAIGALAITEAIVGQLYLAITVARLVGLHLAGPAEPRK